MMELPIKATPRLRKEIEDWFEEEGLPYFVLDRMGLRALRHALLRIGPSTLFFLLLEARSLWLLLLYSAVGGVIATLFFSLLSLLTHHPLFSLTRWAVQEVWCQIRNLTLLGWVLGFLLAFVTFLFVQAELWEVVGELHGLPLWIALGLFPILGFLVTIIRVPSEIESAARFHDWTDVRKVLAALKVSNLKHLNRLPYSFEPLPKSPSRREQANVALVILFVLGLQFFVAATMIWIFFVLFGMLALNPNTLAGWIGHCPTGLPATPTLMRTLPLSQELLKVAAFIGAFSGLYFTVQAISNDPNRTDFIDRIEVKVRDLLAVRYVYLAVRWGPKVNYDSQGNTYEATFELPAGINANKAYVCGTAMDS
jgi:hypothetical protein